MGKSLKPIHLFSASILLALITIGYGYAQNQTDTDDGSLGAQTAITMGTVAAIIISVLGIIKTLVDKGILDKRVGTGVVMAADATHAVLDTRELVQETTNAILEALRVDNPEVAAKVQNAVQPVLKQIDQKVKEYQPKVDTFAQIANKIGSNGAKTVDAIKENNELKDNIPDAIVSS